MASPQSVSDSGASIERLTLVYEPRHDRMRLDMQHASGNVSGLWLTRRLLDRLLPVLFDQLDQASAAQETLARVQVLPQQASAGAENVFAKQMAQQLTARVSKVPNDPVPAAAKERTSLLVEVKMTASLKAVVLLLVDDSGSVSRLTMEHKQLRQWLQSVLRNYQRAGWTGQPMQWPAWMQSRV